MVLTAEVLCATIYLGVHAAKYPHFEGWFAGVDQGRYLRAARAWAVGNLDPSQHYYPAFYPMLGAAFLWLTPAQPFLVPGLICLLASLLLFVGIATELAPRLPRVRLIAALAFALPFLSGRSALAVWVVPFTTTASAPLVLAALYASLRFAAEPRALWTFTVGMAGAAAIGVRPMDGALALAATGMFCLVESLRHPWKAQASWAIAGVVGILLPFGASIASHLAVFGAHPSPYMELSAARGFEWRLLPLRWVVIALDSRPLFEGGPGLALAFPWILPGIAGMLLHIRERKHVLVAAVVLSHWIVYLSYRDLNPQDLWRFFDFHYFKWTQPFLAFYAALLVQGLWSRPTRRAAVVAALVAIALLPWRAAPVPIQGPSPTVADGTLFIPSGFTQVDDLLIAPATASREDIMYGAHVLRDGSRQYAVGADWKLFPFPGGIMAMPLRALPNGAKEMQLFPPGVFAEGHPIEAKARIRLAAPCGLALVAGCSKEQALEALLGRNRGLPSAPSISEQ